MGRTVLILGANSDIGLALGRMYLESGWTVIGHHRSGRAEFEALVDCGLEPWQADFGAEGGLDRALAELEPRATSIDAFVNLAAEIVPCPFATVGAVEILRALTVNALPGQLIAARLGPEMARREWGRIVQASSIGVKFGGGADTFPYSLSKHALEFIPAAARQWAKRGVCTNVVRIGVTDTRAHKAIPGKDLSARAALIPAGRAAQPTEIAELLFWLGSERNGYVTGEIIAASGGE